MLNYTTRVVNIVSNDGNGSAVGTLLTNSVAMSFATGSAIPAAVTAPVEVIEPTLVVTKSVDDATPRLGQTITYRLDISHAVSSDTDAFDLSVQDTVPALATLDLASLSVTGANVVANNSTGNVLDLELDQLLRGDSVAITYQATVTSDESQISGGLSNTASMQWTSLAGDDTGERNGDDGVGGPLSDYANVSTADAVITQPILDVAKSYSNIGANSANDTHFDVTVNVVMQNNGNVIFTDLSLIEDLVGHFGPSLVAVTRPTVINTAGLTSGGTVPTLNGLWDGNLSGGGQTDLLLGSDGQLRPGESISLQFIATVDPDATGGAVPLENQVEGRVQFTDDGVPQPLSDLSDSGTDAAGSNPGEPGDSGGEDDPTPLEISDIAVAKYVLGRPTQLANGNWLVDYELVVENTGNVPLTNLQLSEDLEREFGVGVFVGVVSLPVISVGPTLPGSVAPSLAGWDGGLDASGNTILFDGVSGTLLPADSFVVRFSVEVDPDNDGESSALRQSSLGRR